MTLQALNHWDQLIRFKSLHLIQVHLLRKPPAQAKPPFRPQASMTLRQTQRVLCTLLVARSFGHGIGDTARGILDSAASTLRCVTNGIRRTLGGVASGFSDSTDYAWYLVGVSQKSNIMDSKEGMAYQRCQLC